MSIIQKELTLQMNGILDFEPTTQDGKGGNPWWLILRCDDEVVRYYLWWIEKTEGIKLQRPLFGAHISVMRGEEAQQNATLWKEQQDTTCDFRYSHIVETQDGFWWLPVESRMLREIRAFYGLSPLPDFGFHLTIGRR
tara:strand:+ start:20082 stop:20495 length:414 start_codon:yes stop_codon:yes gene_type:complete